MTAPRIGISMGCPSGVGPEICARVAERSRVLVIGDVAVMKRACRVANVRVPVYRVNAPGDAWVIRSGKGVFVYEPPPTRRRRALKLSEAPFGKPSRAGGAAQLAYVDAGCRLAQESLIDALVTAPVSKSAVAKTLPTFVGHTEHLRDLLGAREVVMAFWHRLLTTALVTNHEPLARVPRLVTRARVESAVFWLASLLRDTGIQNPRLVVCALNPHASEGGMFGAEESRTIVPGIAAARRRLASAKISARITGPTGAETAFRNARDGAYDGVVAMYHDQATIPMKLIGFGDAVNVSLGLPIIRTSVDHGTAYDIAGRGIAEARGLRTAFRLAQRLVRSRTAR